MIAVDKRCKFYATKWMYRYLFFQIEVDEDGIRLKTNIYKYPTTKYNPAKKIKYKWINEIENVQILPDELN